MVVVLFTINFGISVSYLFDISRYFFAIVVMGGAERAGPLLLFKG